MNGLVKLGAVAAIGFGLLAVAAPANASVPTRMTLSASPMAVPRGNAITVSGRAWASTHGESHSVFIYFERAGTRTFTRVGTVRSTSTGAFSAKYTATVSGNWRATTGAAVSPTRYVRVYLAPMLLAQYSGSGDWQSATIRIPTKDYRAVVSYRCTDPSGGFLFLDWYGQPYGFEYADGDAPAGTVILNGHAGATTGYFTVNVWIDCSWQLSIYTV